MTKKRPYKSRSRVEPEKIVVEVPKNKVVRYKKMHVDGKPDAIHYAFDFRGIRNSSYVHGILKDYGGPQQFLKSAEETQKKVDEYFQSCDGPLVDKHGVVQCDKNGDVIYVQTKPYTVAGLSYHLGFTTLYAFEYYIRGAYDDYGETDERKLVSQVLKKAKHKIEAYAESRLYDKEGNNGAKFLLDSRYGWTTTKEAAEIRKMEFEQWKEYKELELKQQLQDMGVEDSTLQIQIVRKSNDD